MKRRVVISRKKNSRFIKNKIVIVCEGIRTEINYFNSFKTRYSGVEIIALHPGNTDPINICKEAKKSIKKFDLELNNGDSLWCVFDVDDRQNNTFQEVKQICGNKVNIGLSNPCIELWFLLHFENATKRIERVDVIRQLRQYITKYDKSMDIREILRGYEAEAIIRAQELNQSLESRQIEKISTESNPSTQVYLLVEHIHRITENNLKSRIC